MRRLLYLLALPVLYQPAAAETILVSEDSPGGPYDWPLWVAIDAAAPGDTIRVAGGNYMGGLRIDKPLTLLGAEVYSTWVHGDHSYSSVFVITAEAVTIEGFYLRGCDRCPTIACRGCSAILRHNTISGYSWIRITGDSRLTINYNEFGFSYGAVDDYVIRSLYNSHPVDARFNWWKTTDEDKIKKRMHSNRGKIEYRPWLQNQDAVFTKTSTLISTISWGWLKRKGR